MIWTLILPTGSCLSVMLTVELEPSISVYDVLSKTTLGLTTVAVNNLRLDTSSTLWCGGCASFFVFLKNFLPPKCVPRHAIIPTYRIRSDNEVHPIAGPVEFFHFRLKIRQDSCTHRCVPNPSHAWKWCSNKKTTSSTQGQQWLLLVVVTYCCCTNGMNISSY